MATEITDAIRQQLAKAAEQEKPLTVTTYTFLADAQAFTDKLLDEFLKDNHLEHLYDALSYCIRELAVNAKKANTKRIYFEEKSLNPHNHDDYVQGIKDFKETMLQRQDYYLKKLKEKNYFIKIEFLRWQNYASFAVKNNVEILPVEAARVKEKIQKSQQYESLEEAFVDVMDDEEGAGLGLVILMIMMRSSGVRGDFLHIYPKNGETVARIIVPLTQ